LSRASLALRHADAARSEHAPRYPGGVRLPAKAERRQIRRPHGYNAMDYVAGGVEWSERILANLAAQIGLALPRILSGVVIILLFLALAWGLRRLFRGVAHRFDMEQRPLVNLGAETAWFTAITLGFIIGFGTMGVDVTALVAGLGLTGFALGFALRDAVSNLLAGVLIILYQPFRSGDRIEVASSAGRVLGINLRYTVLDAGDRRILVPNSNLFSNSVVVHRETDKPEKPPSPTAAPGRKP
jgi:small conductance mechanosensitive channel